MSKLIELREEIAYLARQQAEVSAKHADASTLTEDELGEVNDRQAKMLAKLDEFKKLQAADDMFKAAREVHEQFNKPAGGMIHPSPAPEEGKGQIQPVYQSFGDQVYSDANFKNWLESAAPNGHFSDKVHVQSPRVHVKTLVTGASSTSAGAMVFNDVQPGIVQVPFRPLSLRDIVTVGQTGSDTVEYVRVTGYTNNAAAVAEATSAGGISGSKPESGLALDTVTANVRTIATWIPVTRQALADAPQINTLINNFLREALDQVLEDEMATGDGTGQHFTGLTNISGRQTQAWDTDVLRTTRKARTLVATVGRDRPNAFVMHPNDWQTIDLLQDNEARYFMGGPRELSQPRLWGLPVVECEAVTEGEAFVGNFKQCVLWDRQQTTIQMSDSHSDFFTRNLIAILAELRAAFGCLRPASIVEIDMAA